MVKKQNFSPQMNTDEHGSQRLPYEELYHGGKRKPAYVYDSIVKNACERFHAKAQRCAKGAKKAYFARMAKQYMVSLPITTRYWVPSSS